MHSTMSETPKNKHAQALGRLGGRKPGFTGKPLDPAKARAMVASRWAKYRAKQTVENKG